MNERITTVQNPHSLQHLVFVCVPVLHVSRENCGQDMQVSSRRWFCTNPGWNRRKGIPFPTTGCCRVTEPLRDAEWYFLQKFREGHETKELQHWTNVLQVFFSLSLYVTNSTFFHLLILLFSIPLFPLSQSEPLFSILFQIFLLTVTKDGNFNRNNRLVIFVCFQMFFPV